ncbi:pirin family protein [Nitrospira defluvii]|nr:pirin family protein [Nitrospira defluvii]
MDTVRKIKKIYKSKPVIEGAGVRLKRVFGFPELPQLDPFLLMDDFHSSNPDDYMAGFPMHPHRGIETITYMIHGTVAHRDSMGNSGIIHDGDLQWMTAGSGIIHEEMPQDSEELWGFQLWSNLPAENKMMAPRYRDIKGADIPIVSPEDQVKIKVICGEVCGTKGPIQEIVTDPQYLDISINADSNFEHKVNEGYTAFAYIIEGEGFFDEGKTQTILSENLVLFEDGNRIKISAKQQALRFLLISGKPIKEPIVWAGPIVMNTQTELDTAFKEYQNGTFIK